MDTRAWRTGLRALAHPATLLSIGLLLLNDHYLKAAAPCWLTGKLSDLAGLFFFPFLLAASLGLLLARLRPLSPLALGRVSLLATALGFAAVKATPWGNALAVRLASALLGQPARIMLDPTDLLALVVLWPAWALWRQAARAPLHLPGRLGWAALALASVATLATSYPRMDYVQRIVVLDGQIYALTEYGYPTFGSMERRYFQTTDHGRTWSQTEEVPLALRKEKPRAAGETIVVNDPRRLAVRYRLQSGTEQVERSDDDGLGWRTAWKIPSGRRLFMERYSGMGDRPSIALHDLAFTPDGSALIVAMGSEGVLVRDGWDAWNRYAVGAAEPTPYASLEWFWTLSAETLLCALSTIPVAVLLTGVGWAAIARAIGRKAIGATIWLLLELLYLGATVLLVARDYLHSASSSGGGGEEILFLLVLFSPLVVLVCSLRVWRSLEVAARDRMAARRPVAAFFVTTFAAPALVLLGFILWAIGVIPWYEAGMAIGLTAGVLTFVGGAWRIYRQSRAALAPPPVAPPA